MDQATPASRWCCCFGWAQRRAGGHCGWARTNAGLEKLRTAIDRLTAAGAEHRVERQRLAGAAAVGQRSRGMPPPGAE